MILLNINVITKKTFYKKILTNIFIKYKIQIKKKNLIRNTKFF